MCSNAVCALIDENCAQVDKMMNECSVLRLVLLLVIDFACSLFSVARHIALRFPLALPLSRVRVSALASVSGGVGGWGAHHRSPSMRTGAHSEHFQAARRQRSGAASPAHARSEAWRSCRRRCDSLSPRSLHHQRASLHTRHSSHTYGCGKERGMLSADCTEWGVKARTDWEEREQQHQSSHSTTGLHTTTRNSQHDDTTMTHMQTMKTLVRPVSTDNALVATHIAHTLRFVSQSVTI